MRKNPFCRARYITALNWIISKIHTLPYVPHHCDEDNTCIIFFWSASFHRCACMLCMFEGGGGVQLKRTSLDWKKRILVIGNDPLSNLFVRFFFFLYNQVRRKKGWFEDRTMKNGGKVVVKTFTQYKRESPRWLGLVSATRLLLNKSLVPSLTQVMISNACYQTAPKQITGSKSNSSFDYVFEKSLQCETGNREDFKRFFFLLLFFFFSCPNRKCKWRLLKVKCSTAPTIEYYVRQHKFVEKSVQHCTCTKAD